LTLALYGRRYRQSIPQESAQANGSAHRFSDGIYLIKACRSSVSLVIEQAKAVEESYDSCLRDTRTPALTKTTPGFDEKGGGWGSPLPSERFTFRDFLYASGGIAGFRVGIIVGFLAQLGPRVVVAGLITGVAVIAVHEFLDRRQKR